MGNNSTSVIVNVHFHDPLDGKTDYYFGSLKAIYTQLTPEQVGCDIGALYRAGIKPGSKKVTDKCVVSKQIVFRSKQNKEK